MKINAFFNTLNNNNYSKKNNSNNTISQTESKKAYSCNLNSNPLSAMNQSLISFGMDKKDFQGIDLMMLEQLKAPVRNFKEYKDFQNYCQEILDKTDCTVITRSELQKTRINDWFKVVQDKPASVKLMILPSLIKGLEKNQNSLLPILDTEIFNQTINQIENDVTNNRKLQFNFDKQYKAALVRKMLKDDNLNEDTTGWVIIPLTTKDSACFKYNTEKMQTLSHKSWCTSHYNASCYLEKGDLHIYFEKAKPRLALRFVGDKIVEIQGVKNDNNIPVKYFDIMTDHVKHYEYEFADKAEIEFQKTQELKNTIDKIKERISKYKPDDYEHILPKLGIKTKKDEKDGMLSLSHYSQLYKNISLSDLGIDENDLFQHVKIIKRNANFSHSELKSLGKLISIGGNTSFCDSGITDLGDLKEIGGHANFNFSDIENLGKLERIGNGIDIQNSKLEINAFSNICFSEHTKHKTT